VQVLFAEHVHDSDAPPEVLPRVFGGFAFRADDTDDAFWKPFGAGLFVLPRLLLTRMAGFHWLTVCDCAPDSPRAARLAEARATFAAVQAEIDAQAQKHPGAQVGTTQGSSAAAPPLPAAISHAPTLLMSRDQWRAMVERGIGMISAGRLRKIVLARAQEAARGEGCVDAWAALTALERQYPTAYRFLLRPPGSATAFFGATPELLVRLENGELHSHALAGSAPRGTTPDEDDRLGKALLTSTKDRHEHELVVNWLRASLAPISRALDIPPEPAVVMLRNIQHLFTPVHGQLRERQPVLRIVERLHPTPALGGDPQAEAVTAIAELEPTPRGWYGAPVGWVDSAGGGEFAVAIRSAVSAGARVRLYAGAGIMGDSDPDKEWDETALKFRPMMGALGLE
jgi:menaquinone-specific isochorismate synthase